MNNIEVIVHYCDHDDAVVLSTKSVEADSMLRMSHQKLMAPDWEKLTNQERETVKKLLKLQHKYAQWAKTAYEDA